MSAAHDSFDFRLAFGSRVRTSPFFDATVAAGATHFTTYNHMLMPVSYGDQAVEYRRLTEQAAVWDVAVQRQVELRGPDAAELAQLIAARDLTGMDVGQGRYAPVCDHDGLLLNDPLVLRPGREAYWVSIADSDLLLWIRAIGNERGLDVDVHEVDVAPLAVQGPRAEDTVAVLLGDWVRDVRSFRFVRTELDGIPLLVGRAGWSKQGGFELYLLDPDRGTDLWSRVMAAGEPFDIGPGAPNFVERLESGLFSFGTDAPPDADPFEVGLGRWVSLDSAVPFIGKAALEAKARAGLRRELVGVRMEGDPVQPAARPWPARVDSAVVGAVRAAAHSPRFETNIGLAFLDVPANAPGTQLTVDAEGEVRRAVVVALPFGA